MARQRLDPISQMSTQDLNARHSNQTVLTAILALFLFQAAVPLQAELPPANSNRQQMHSDGWSSLGAMPTPVWDGKTLLYKGEQGVLSITPLSDDVVRVHFTKDKLPGRDHSYAIINRDLGGIKVEVKTNAERTELRTHTLMVVVQHHPLRISFANSAGQILDADDAERGIAYAGSEFRVSKRLLGDEHIYGFGEKNGRLDKRGWQLGGYNLVMWNSDIYAYDSSADPMYVSVPFYLSIFRGQAHGLFLDNTWRSSFDVGREQPGLLTFGAVDGDLDYYFINGPDPKKVIERYTALTGRSPLPPLWALGFNQCRYSYYPESRVREIANTFREKKIPADVIWLDIHYQDGYKPFTWDHERFPEPQEMLTALRAQEFQVVCIVDPHPKKERGYAPYDQGVAGDYFVKNPDGTIFEGTSWPASAAKNPGPSVFPDFSKPAAREWWGSLYRSFLDQGVAGIWNDMNEPSVGNTIQDTMPLNVVFDNEGQPSTHRELHNVYGQLMSRATFEGLSRLRPNERPFVLTRASFAGGQRYAAVWTGDNTSDWASLRQSIPTLLGMGVSGFPFVGADIGGFSGMPSGELYTRWLQVGVFSPFMRSHSEIGRPNKEPWSFGEHFTAINRRAIELRYELLPYIYNAMEEASRTGVPALRPLFLEFPNDPAVAASDREFLFGESLLVAPVLHEAETERDIYLPRGEWFDYWTGHRFAGGKTIRVPVTLDSIPMFVRGGGFIFRQPAVQSTRQMRGNPLHVLIAPADESQASLYEDDGETPAGRGNYLRRHFHQVRGALRTTVAILAPEGSYRPPVRDLYLEIMMDQAPRTVSILRGTGNQEEQLARMDDTRLSGYGWNFQSGVLTIRVEDGFEPMRFVLQQ